MAHNGRTVYFRAGLQNLRSYPTLKSKIKEPQQNKALLPALNIPLVVCS